MGRSNKTSSKFVYGLMMKTIRVCKASQHLAEFCFLFNKDFVTDILSGKTVNGGSYTLKTGQALVLVNSAVVK